MNIVFISRGAESPIITKEFRQFIAPRVRTAVGVTTTYELGFEDDEAAIIFARHLVKHTFVAMRAAAKSKVFAGEESEDEVSVRAATEPYHATGDVCNLPSSYRVFFVFCFFCVEVGAAVSLVFIFWSYRHGRHLPSLSLSLLPPLPVGTTTLTTGLRRLRRRLARRRGGLQRSS